MLVLRHLAPEWIHGELHVEVHGRRFMIGHHPFGVAVRTLAAMAPVIFDDPDEALAALGLRS